MAELHCPDTRQLQQLLTEKLDAAKGSELSAHVEGCSACQKTLESLSPMSQSWTDVLAGIACEEPAPEPGLERVLKSAAPADTSETQDEPAAGEHAESLAFLAPPAKPGHLGRLGHYEIHEVIGRGGFGIVLKAFDEKLHRVVAVKVLSPQLAASATARNRFSREARAAAAVTHDHVVTIHVVDEDHRPPFLVMQMIDGQTLQQKLNKVGALNLTEILRIGMQTAAGLAAAHKQGLIHRDIKPANILLENGVERVKITDFGLARLADDASITQSGVVAGTPMYMSPEQANGEAIDYRSDLFSLGTVLYVMCTGRPPFRASGTIAVLKRVIDDTPRPIREINPEIPEWLCDIITKLHAKKPADRFQSAQEVAAVLGQYLAKLQAHGGMIPDAETRAASRNATDAPAVTAWPAAAKSRSFSWFLLFNLAAISLLGLTVLNSILRLDAIIPHPIWMRRLWLPVQFVILMNLTWLGWRILKFVFRRELPLGTDGPRPRSGHKHRRLLLAASLLGMLAAIFGFFFWPRDVGLPGVKVHSPVALNPGKPISTDPFVVLAKDNRAESHHATLAAAVVWAQSGDTIEIRGDGPFTTGPINLQKKALTIRAGGGFRPHLKYQPTDPKAKGALLVPEAPLVLEGLILERAAHPSAEDYLLGTRILHAYKAPLHVVHCRLIGTKIDTAAFWQHSPGGILRNTEILGDTASGVQFNPVSSSLLSIENNLIAVKRHGLWFGQYPPDLAKAVMTVRHNTMRSVFSLNFSFHPSLDFVEEFDPKAPGLRLDALGNVFDSTPFYFSPAHESLPLEKAAPLLPKLLSFQDDYNLYVRSKGTHFLSVNREGPPKGLHHFETLAEWHQFWGIAKSTSQVGTPVYQGGDVLAKALIAPNRLTPADFRLPKGSPGQGVLPDGKDLGADVDLVGPGEAYEHWKKTPEYQEWRKKTDALMVQATAATQPFVVLAKDKRAESRYPTLAAAVDAAHSGDTIEIRGNGPFETVPIDIQKRVLTIRAGQGWRPVVSLHQEALANAKVEQAAEETLSLLRTEAALLLEGLQLQVLDPKLVKTGQQRPAVVCIHSFGGSLHLANCSIVMSRKGPALPNMRAIRTYDPAHVSAKNCTFQGEMGQMIALDLFARADGRLEALLDNCTLVGHGGVNIYAARTRRLGSIDLVIRQTTCWTNNFVALGSLPSDLEGENMTRMTTRQNVVAGNLWYDQRAPGRPVSEALPYLKRLMKWQEEKTLWFNRPEQGLSLLIVDEEFKLLPDQPKISSLEDWNRIWALADTGSILGTPRFVNADLLSKVSDSAPSLTPADFRLAKGSPGQGVLRGGKDLGADVDLVGPGAAYERWKQTPAYQEWLKKTRQLMEGN